MGKSKNKVKINLTNLKHEIKSTIKDNNLTIVEEEKHLITSCDLENIEALNITKNEVINSKLKEKATEFVNFSVTGALWIGRHLEEVFNLLDENPQQQATYYNEYLNYININERTARRYRKRFLIFSKFSSDDSKKLISTLSDADIQFLDDNPNLIERIEKENISKEEFKNLKTSILINAANQKKLPPTTISTFNFSKFTEKVNSVQERMNLLKDSENKLDQEILKNIQKYLDKIEKILANSTSNKNSEEDKIENKEE